MIYYPEPDSHIRDKVRVALDLVLAAGVDTSNLVDKSDFIALKAGVDKLDINKLVSVPTSSNNLRTKLDDLDVIKLKIVPIDLKKLSDCSVYKSF